VIARDYPGNISGNFSGNFYGSLSAITIEMIKEYSIGLAEVMRC